MRALAVAQELELILAGTAAVIDLTSQSSLGASAKAVFALLHSTDFHIVPEVIRAVLEQCGE